MHPIPCNHCGTNFMRQTLDPEAPKLCNNCSVREEKRNPKKKEFMEDTIYIQIMCPVAIHNEIEEFCINNGMTLSKYFINLHNKQKNSLEPENVKEEFVEVKEVEKIYKKKK